MAAVGVVDGEERGARREAMEMEKENSNVINSGGCGGGSLAGNTPRAARA
jgi:hypothetical protein